MKKPTTGLYLAFTRECRHVFGNFSFFQQICLVFRSSCMRFRAVILDRVLELTVTPVVTIFTAFISHHLQALLVWPDQLESVLNTEVNPGKGQQVGHFEADGLRASFCARPKVADSSSSATLPSGPGVRHLLPTQRGVVPQVIPERKPLPWSSVEQKHHFLQFSSQRTEQGSRTGSFQCNLTDSKIKFIF